MRVLMFGWEFPPYVSGGLGVACEGLVRGLLELSTEVCLVLPRRVESATPGLRILSAGGPARSRRSAPRLRRLRLRVRRIRTLLQPYVTEEAYAEEVLAFSGAGSRPDGLYGPDLHREVLRYADEAARIAARETFDVIHAHDWLTFMAGMRAKRASGQPLVLHVHATEFDRTGNCDGGFVVGVERAGLAAADRVIAVSAYTADVLVSPLRPATRDRSASCTTPSTPARCGPGGPSARAPRWSSSPAASPGRRARTTSSTRPPGSRPRCPTVRFAVAGAGDRLRPMMQRVADSDLRRPLPLHGIPAPGGPRSPLRARPTSTSCRRFRSRSASRRSRPCSTGRPSSSRARPASRRSCATSCASQFGDVEDLASKILSVLLFPPLKDALSTRGRAEVERLSWRESAWRCRTVYRELVAE